VCPIFSPPLNSYNGWNSSRFFEYGEISALTIQPYDLSEQFSNYVAIGFYESNMVCIVKAVDLTHLALPSIPLPHLPVSLLLGQFGLEGTNRRPPTEHSKTYPSHLLIGLGDGNLHVLSLNFVQYVANVMEQKVIPLGTTRPVFLSTFRLSIDGVNVGAQCIMAHGTIPAVLYWDNGRLKHSLIRKVCALFSCSSACECIFRPSAPCALSTLETSLHPKYSESLATKTAK
jgi:hypothetical protein